MLFPFLAAHYSVSNLRQLGQLVVSDLDTAEHLWGGRDSSRSFRNVLMGPPEHRGEIWHGWISSGDIELSEEERFWVLHQSQRVEGCLVDRWAVYATASIDDPSLFVHEDVLPEGVERARQGTESCEGDMAPIFVGCEERVGSELRRVLGDYCRDREPFLRFESYEQGAHSVWPVRDPAVGARISQLFEGTPLFLLDGHHRLAAARANARLGLSDGRILACVCSMASTDTLILPIHRAVSYERWMLPEQLLGDLHRAGCRVRPLPALKVSGIPGFLTEHRSQEPFCLVQHSHGLQPLLVEFPAISKLAPQLASLAVAHVDGTVLAQHPQATVMPVPSCELALQQLALDQSQAVFFVPPATTAQVRSIAISRMRMPRKSTRFVPKPVLGLVSRPWTSSG